MGEDALTFIVSLRGGSEAASELAKVKGAVAAAGGEIRKVGEQSTVASAGAGKLTGGIKRLAFAFVALGAGYKAYSAAKTAISYTKELAESSKALSSATGLNIESSSRYVGVSGALGVSSTLLNTAFKSLATQTEKQAGKTSHAATESKASAVAKINEALAVESLNARLAKGSITQSAYNLEMMKLNIQHKEATSKAGGAKTAFDRLGISTAWAKAHQKDFNAVILTTVERLNAMKGGPEKLKVETELFGRSWAALNPLLGEGRGHLEHILDLAKKYGVELHGGVNKELEQLKEAQLESTLASDGLRISFTKTLGGPLLGMIKGFARLKNDVRLKDWPAFDKELSQVMVVAARVLEDFEAVAVKSFGKLAPKLLNAIWHGFRDASLGNEALIAGFVATKLGFTGALLGPVGAKAGAAASKGLSSGLARGKGAVLKAGALLGGIFVGGFETVAIAGLYAWEGAKALLGPKMVARFAFAGGVLGAAFETAFVAGLGYLAFDLGKKIAQWMRGVHFHFDLGRVIHGKSPIWITEDKPLAPLPQREAESNKQLLKRGLGRWGYLEHPAASPPQRGKPTGHGRIFDPGSGGAMPQIVPVVPGAHSAKSEAPTYLVVDGKVLGRALKRQANLSQAAGA